MRTTTNLSREMRDNNVEGVSGINLMEPLKYSYYYMIQKMVTQLWRRINEITLLALAMTIERHLSGWVVQDDHLVRFPNMKRTYQVKPAQLNQFFFQPFSFQVFLLATQ